jgi:tetratricopeptide (TPR) repeat protein
MEVAEAYNAKAAEAFLRGDVDAAALQYSQALAIQRELMRVDKHVCFAESYFNLGNCAFAREDFTIAVEWFEKAIAIEMDLQEKNPRDFRKDLLAMTYFNLALALQEAGMFELALENNLKARDLFAYSLGTKHELAKNADNQAKELKMALLKESKVMGWFSCWCCVSMEKKKERRKKEREKARRASRNNINLIGTK